MASRQSRKSSFDLHPAVGTTRLQSLADFAFHAFRLFASFAGIGISRSLYPFGVHLLSGLWLTRTVDAARIAMCIWGWLGPAAKLIAAIGPSHDRYLPTKKTSRVAHVHGMPDVRLYRGRTEVGAVYHVWNGPL